MKTLIITPSGALSPGPLSLATIALGSTMGWISGLLVALGHTVFELPFVALLARSTLSLEKLLRSIEKPLVLAITIFIAYFAYLLAMDSYRLLMGLEGVDEATGLTGFGGTLLDAFIVGLALTGFNPHFLLWWVTVGFPLVRDAATYGRRGLAVMYASHVWMDYAWLILLAGGGGAATLMGRVGYGIFLAILAALLLLFAIDILLRTYTGRKLLPF